MSDIESRLKLLVKLADFFGKQLTESSLESYLEAVEDISTPRLDHAIKRSIREDEFFPKPFQIRIYAPLPSAAEENAAWRKSKEQK